MLSHEFKPYCSLVLYWDCKLLPKCFGLGKVDRLPVIVSGPGVENLIGVPKLSETVKNKANYIFALKREWGGREKHSRLSFEVKLHLSFDFTSVNTDCLNGA